MLYRLAFLLAPMLATGVNALVNAYAEPTYGPGVTPFPIFEPVSTTPAKIVATPSTTLSSSTQKPVYSQAPAVSETPLSLDVLPTTPLGATGVNPTFAPGETPAPILVPVDDVSSQPAVTSKPPAATQPPAVAPTTPTYNQPNPSKHKEDSDDYGEGKYDGDDKEDDDPADDTDPAGTVDPTYPAGTIPTPILLPVEPDAPNPTADPDATKCKLPRPIRESARAKLAERSIIIEGRRDRRMKRAAKRAAIAARAVKRAEKAV
ncbi:hypothetical protein Cpir12675_003954 [Ceratocystis pirilliformis]|uniref:Uncharacterized protein n=1 Tax=Ceratocystis pirilliformis TaxID=259994 RepID=A0ABR3Z1B2_9PEZI